MDASIGQACEEQVICFDSKFDGGNLYKVDKIHNF